MTPIDLLLLDSAPPWVLTGASADLDFVNNRAWAQQGGSMGTLLTTTRAAVGYGGTSAGGLTLFQANVPRITDLGLLVEQASTNLALRSQQFDQADGWITTNNISVSADSTVAPDNTTTADTFTENTSAGTHEVIQQFTTTSGATYAFSVYVKPGTSSFAFMTWSSTAANYVTVVANLSTGAITQTAVGGTSGTLASSAVDTLGNGWYRIRFAGSITATSTSLHVGLASAATGNTLTSVGIPTYTGTSKTTVFWGSQLEASAFPTSYIPTTTVAVTRAADNIQITGAAFNALAATTGSLVLSIGTIFNPTAASGYLLNGGGTTNYITPSDNTSAQISLGANHATATLGGSTNFTTSATKVAASWSASDMNIVANNGTVATNANVFNFATPLYLMGKNGASVNNVYTKRLTVFPSEITGNALKALSQ